MSVGLFVPLLALAVVLKQSKPLVLLVFWALAVGGFRLQHHTFSTVLFHLFLASPAAGVGRNR